MNILQSIYENAFKDEMNKIAAEVAIPPGGLKPGLWMNDITQVMTDEDAKKVKEKYPWYKRSGPGLIPASVVGAFGASGLANVAKAIKLRSWNVRTPPLNKAAIVGAIALPLIGGAATRLGLYDKSTLSSAKKLVDSVNDNNV